MLIFENILWLLVLIGVMIMIHELGHFWAARFFDVKVETFSFGFGPQGPGLVRLVRLAALVLLGLLVYLSTLQALGIVRLRTLLRSIR